MGDELDDYSAVAEQQLDTLEVADPDTYNDVLAMCELIFSNPGRAQSLSTAVKTRDGIVFRLPVPGHAPLKVFWTPAGPRVEAVFPHP
jgi:hypothetical protein